MRTLDPIFVIFNLAIFINIAMPLFIDLILHVVLASCLGGCSYLLWLKISERWPRAISEFTVLFSVTFVFVFGLFPRYQYGFLIYGFVVPCFLGSWFHLKTLKRKYGFRAWIYSALVLYDATWAGCFLGTPFLILFPIRPLAGEASLVFDAFGISLLVAPSIAALLVWCWQSIEPRAGIDVHIDE